MIYKSFLVENNIDILKNRLVLFYGENIGLLSDFKNLIINKNYKNEILRFTQDEILRDSRNFLNEISNISLFQQNKIILIFEVNEKLLDIISEIKFENKNIRIFLFAKVLEKKSKLRNFFENSSKVDIVACYQDNEINLKKIISRNLKEYKGINHDIMNIILTNCNNDRAKLNNELDKIKSYFTGKVVNIEEIEKILNIKEEDNFNVIQNSALCGNKKNTNELLSSTVIDVDRTIFYLSSLNLRLCRLKEISEKKNTNLESAINEIKPPIFWKEKPVFLQQAKMWNENKITKALNKVYDTEIKIKTNSNINKSIILKNLIIDICNLAIAA